MGKRYHCDFCGKSFQDNPQSRKRHLNGISHQRNRRLHYESVMVQTQMEEVGRHSNVSLLRSTMTGEDILQVWLKQHPEVSRSPQEHQAKVSGEHQPKVSVLDAPRSKGSRDQLSVLPNSVPRDEDDMEIPQELAPYENLLPPSLLPPTLQYGMYLATPTRWGEV